MSNELIEHTQRAEGCIENLRSKIKSCEMQLRSLQNDEGKAEKVLLAQGILTSVRAHDALIEARALSREKQDHISQLKRSLHILIEQVERRSDAISHSSTT